MFLIEDCIKISAIIQRKGHHSVSFFRWRTSRDLSRAGLPREISVNFLNIQGGLSLIPNRLAFCVDNI